MHGLMLEAAQHTYIPGGLVHGWSCTSCTGALLSVAQTVSVAQHDNVLQYHKPARSTHSSASHLLSVPRHNLFIWCSRFPRRCAQNMELYLFTSASPKHTLPSDVILRRHRLLSFSPSCPLAAPAMRPDSLPRLWRYINLLLTYLHDTCVSLGQHIGLVHKTGLGPDTCWDEVRWTWNHRFISLIYIDISQLWPDGWVLVSDEQTCHSLRQQRHFRASATRTIWSQRLTTSRTYLTQTRRLKQATR